MNFNKKFYDEVVEVFNSECLSCIKKYEYDVDDIDADYLNQKFNWFCEKYDCRFAAGVFRISIIFNNEEYIIKYDKSLDKDSFELEEYYYTQAAEKGLEKFLVPIGTYYTDSGIEYGVQEKVIISSFDDLDGFSAETNRSYRRISSIVPIYKVFNFRDIFMLFIQYYGEDLAGEFCSFCYDCGINDIHGGNYGYLNGAPVIFDYAGC